MTYAETSVDFEERYRNCCFLNLREYCESHSQEEVRDGERITCKCGDHMWLESGVWRWAEAST